MDFFEYIINSDKWIIYLIDKDDNVITDENISAEVRFDEREIYFRRNNITQKIILHELWHAFMSYCYLNDTNDIMLSDFEEITASLFSDRCEKILELTKDLLVKLKDLNEKME